MRRWRAIPMASIVALSVGPMLAVGALMFTNTPTKVSAGVTTPVEFYLDCGNGIGVNCTFASGTTTLDVQAKIKNNTGGAIGASALQIAVQGDNQAIFAPTTPACASPALDCNPDLNQAGLAGFNCGSPLPSADQNASGSISESNIGCSNGAPNAGILADGGTLLIATVHYTVSGDGVANFSFNNTAGGQGALFTDENFSELGSCNPEVAVTANCFGVTVQIGSSAATNTPVPTSTNTATPAPTNTPCVTGCTPTSTATSVAFKTVTPTPGPKTATPVTTGGSTPVVGGNEPPPAGGQPGGTGSAPSGNAGAGGSRPIRLPDTGSATPDSTSSLLMAAMATAAAGVVAGGLYFGLAAATDKRRREGDD